MFVVSVSKNKIKKSVLIGFVVIVISFSMVLLLKCIKDSQGSGIINENSLVAVSENDILSFISGYGWQVD